MRVGGAVGLVGSNGSRAAVLYASRVMLWKDVSYTLLIRDLPSLGALCYLSKLVRRTRLHAGRGTDCRGDVDIPSVSHCLNLNPGTGRGVWAPR